MECLRVCKELCFGNVVLSVKASNTVVMVQTVRLLVQAMEAEEMKFPLHLGVTEAGDGEDGRIKSAAGIGALLADGIGDTVRVSLSEKPEAEIPVARKLVEYISQREGHAPIQAALATGYNTIQPTRRISRPVGDIGGGQLPIVLPIGRNPYPSDVHFVPLTLPDLTSECIEKLSTNSRAVAILSSHHANPVGELRAAMHRLLMANCPVPVLFRLDYKEKDLETFLIKAAADFGTLLLDGFGDGIVEPHNLLCTVPSTEDLAYGILQAVRLRMSKTEYIACPGCGRTLFDLSTTLANVRNATAHLKGLKIAVMGCIVNGPGEMADADYGYVGAGAGQVNLYKGKRCILRNVPEEEAANRLIALIQSETDGK
jgi:(E)-4-hydroxy-3-methylbut-2-enyl-diphosphate synthase